MAAPTTLTIWPFRALIVTFARALILGATLANQSNLHDYTILEEITGMSILQ